MTYAMIDAIRFMKLAINNNISGPLIEPSSYLMKSPPVQYPDSIAKQKTEEFINKYAKKTANKTEKGKDSKEIEE